MCGKKPFQRETPGLCPGVRSPPSPRPALEKVRRTFSRRRNLPVARPSANGIGEGRDAAPPAEEVARGPGGKRLGWLSASRVPFPGPERIAGGRGLHPRPDARGSAKDRPTWLFSILSPSGARINEGAQNPATSDLLIRSMPGRRIVAHSGLCFSTLATTTVMSSAISPS